MLHLIVGDTVQSRLDANGKIKKLAQSGKPPGEILEEMFILALSRKPTPAESAGLLDLIGNGTQDVEIYEDIFWSLLNSTEFAFNL